MNTTCVILQPSYIPWRGYFHQIQKANVFVFYDDVQYDTGGWRNRNRIKTQQGTKWLTIPIYGRGIHSLQRPINEVEICWDRNWREQHLSTIEHAYHAAPFFGTYFPLLKEWCRSRPVLLADCTIALTLALAGELGIRATSFVRSSSLKSTGAKTDRLVTILKEVGATSYISGPAAKAYLDERQLNDNGICVEWMDYAYPQYPQLHPPFDPYVSIIDLLMMMGPHAPRYIWDCEAAGANIAGQAREEVAP